MFKSIKAKVKSFIIPLFVFCFFTNASKAQNDTLYFRHFSVDNGMSHRNVSSIIQDSLGFMWYGTQEGLNKFDGYKFFPYKHDPKNKNSLISDDITCLTVEKSGIIWIGTKLKGLNRYNPYTEKFDLFQHNTGNQTSLSDDKVTSLLVDTFHKLIWIGTNSGLNSFDIVSQKFKTYKNATQNSFSLSNNSITSITQDKKGIVWIGTTCGGLNSFDYASGKFISYVCDEKNSNSISSNNIRCVFADKQNTIWAATANGLNAFNTSDKTFKIFKHDEKDKNSLSSNNVTSVYQDKYGKIWVGTIGNGLCVYYPKTGKFFLYSHEKEIPNSLSSNKINTISQGRSGMFWAATSDGGLNAFNPKTLKFNLFNPLSENKAENIYEDISCTYLTKNNILLIGTRNNGLFVYNFSDNSVKSYALEKQISYNTVNCIWDIGNGNFLLGTSNGIKEFNLVTGQLSVVNFRGAANEKSNPDTIAVTCIYKDKKNVFWIGTKERGVFCYGGNNKLPEEYISSENKNSLSSNSITTIAEDKTGNIWIGTNGGGLNKLTVKTKQFTVFNNDEKSANAIGSNYVNHLYFDAKGILWITTTGGGLNSFDEAKNKFTSYTVHDGLPGNSFNSILQDDNLNFWLGTDNGICRLTFKENKLTQCRIFDLIDGLPTTEFHESSACKNESGRMLFSCKKGLVSFNPDSLKNNPYKPPVVISDFLLFNKYVLAGDSTGILKTSISVTKELNLNWNQNSFSFEFTAISFINAGKNKYAYKLEGFDTDWNYRNAQSRIATFTNIEPGTYTLRVKASNNDGIWNEAGTSIKITIASPFWKTYWFYGLCLLGLILIGYLINYNRLRNILKMQEVRNKISRDLHDHIGSSLSSISISSEVAKKLAAENSPEASSIIDGIGESSRIAMDNMSDIVWAINPKNDKFIDIVERLKIFANQLFDAKNINLHFNVNETVYEQKLPMQHRKNVYLILKEAINNVAKYSEAKNCFVTIESSGKQIAIQVKDDGRGFVQGKEETLGGNGLYNMQQRVLELNGIFNIFSEENKGTTLSFQFDA